MRFKEFIKFEMLEAGHDYCAKNDKSLEYTIQFLQDTCDASMDEVVNYLKTKTDDSQRKSKRVD